MTLQEQIRSNQIRSFFVMFAFGLLIAAMVFIIGGTYDPGIAGIIGIISITYGVVSYFASGRMIARTAGAHPVTRAEHPRLYHAVDVASIAAGFSKAPQAYIIDDVAPNAFAAGRKPAVAYVAATTGLLDLMDDRELEGVMAHEIAHIQNRDVRLMSIAAVLVGVVALVSDMMMRMTFFHSGRNRNSSLGVVGLVIGIVFAVLAPIFAMFLQMSLSRRREFLADAGAVELTGDPDGLASALAKLGADTHPLRKVTRATAHMYIESPLRDHVGLRSGLGGLFDTHPPLEERIARLQQMGALVRSSAPTH